MIVGILAAAYLVFGYGALSLSNDEAGRFVGNGSALMLSPARNLNNALAAAWPIGLVSFFGILILGIAAYAYSRYRHQRPVVDWRKIGLLLLYYAAAVVITSGYVDSGRNVPTTEEEIKNPVSRYVLP